MQLPTSARFNIVTATIAKLASLVVGVFTVPLLLGLLDQQTYGTWVTLTSMVAFIGLLDLGVGNSLRNTVAAAGSDIGQEVHAEFIASFRLLAKVGLVVMALLAAGAGLPSPFSSHLREAALLYAPPLICLPLLLGNSVLQGAKATGLQATLQATGSVAFFALIGVLVYLQYNPSLAELAIAWSSFYVLALCLTFYIATQVLGLRLRALFGRSAVRLPHGRFRVGLEFLVLQLSSLVLFNLGNLLIFRKLGAAEVARYDVVNKIFQLALSFFTIVLGVMWSEIVHHRAQHDKAALYRVFHRLGLTAIAFTVCALVGAWLTPVVIDHWTGHRLQVSRGEAYAVALLVSIQSLAYVGAVFLNAFERVRGQIVLAVTSILLIAPVSSFLMDRGLGIVSVPLTAGGLTLTAVVFCNLYAVRLIRSVARPAE